MIDHVKLITNHLRAHSPTHALACSLGRLPVVVHGKRIDLEDDLPLSARVPSQEHQRLDLISEASEAA